MKNEKKHNCQAITSELDHDQARLEYKPMDQSSDMLTPLECNELSPSQAAQELIQKTMLACFVDDSKCSVNEREQLIRDAQKLTRLFAKKLLLSPEEENNSQENDEQNNSMSPYALPCSDVAPPSAYFSFRDNGKMHLPIIDWTAFRGYSVAVWINVDFCLAQAKKNDSAAHGDIQKNLYAKFNLFRFTNASNTLGVEASLQYMKALKGSRHVALLNIGCSAPGTTSDAKKSASITALSSHTPEWRRVQREITLVPGKWHLLVISHSLHYVKKSKVTCYVNNTLQFKEELVYPSGLVTASKCTVGGGRNAKVKIASVSMYHDELSTGTIELMYALGPAVSSFTRWSAALPAQSSRMVAGTRERALGSSPLAVPENESFKAFCKLQVVFAFDAQNTVNEDYADLGVEWLCEGIPYNTSGKWLDLETTVGTSAEIQQRNARLGKNTHKMIFPEYRAAWHRSVGISSLPVLLDYILTAYERIVTKQKKTGTTQTVVSLLKGARPLSAIMESVVVDLLWILKGTLISNMANQQEVLKSYVFHMFSHVMVHHKDCLSVVWTPGSLVVCVEMVKSLSGMIRLPKSSHELDDNHPSHVSIWATNPLFASGVRAILMDYRLWTQADFKTQSIYNHQMYGLACEYPRAFNNMHAVSKMLEILRNFYSVSHDSHTSNEKSGTSRNSQQLTKPIDKEHHWKQQSIQSLVEVIEVCLTNQSTHVHEVLEQEVTETTFARASTSAGTEGSSSRSGTGLSQSPSTTSSSSASLSMAASGCKGGVFRIDLESIVWSDQAVAGSASSGSSDVNATNEKGASTNECVLPFVQARFSLVRDIRAVIRFLMTSNDAICISILLMLQRLAVSFLDMRFALISSSIMDCLLYLMQGRRADTESNGSTANKVEHNEGSHVLISIRMACVPLFIYLLDWLESIEGRTVWCGLEEHLRLVLNGQGSFSVGFLELMMEFYYDPAWRLGVQHSIIMNDTSKKKSLLFPVVPVAADKSTPSQETVLEDGVAAVLPAVTATGDMDTEISGLVEWVKLASRVTSKRQHLTWNQRVAVIRLTALRSLSNIGAEVPSQIGREKSSALIADMFEEKVSGILSLPLIGVLPFLPILLGRSTPSFREKVLMDINIKLKTDEGLQQQVLLTKKSWADALLELSLTCSIDVEFVQSSTESADDRSDSSDDTCGRAYSFDGSKTGQDLVLDTIVSLLCVAMNNCRGWQSFTYLLVALKEVRLRYNNVKQGTNILPTVSYLSPLAQVAPHVKHSELLCAPLNWICRVVGIVLQRMARSRTILSRTLAENVQHLLFLVHEMLLILPLKTLCAPCPKPSSNLPVEKYLCYDALPFLLNAVLDICVRLVNSTHKMHRVGLVPGLQILQHALPYIQDRTMMERVVEVLIQTFQQEVAAGLALSVYEFVPTRDVFLRALVDLRHALVVHQKEELLVLLRGLILRICTSGSFVDELRIAGLSVHNLGELTEAHAVEAVLDALALAINDTKLHELEERENMVLCFPVVKELQHSQQRSAEVLDGSVDVGSLLDKKHAQAEYTDDTERVLRATLEAEKNRMLATMGDVISRETQRAVTAYSIQREQKLEWTQRLWLKHEHTFRSQNQYNALRCAAPEALTALQDTIIWRLGLYETPFPSRMRRTVDVDLQLSSEKMLALEAKGSVSYQIIAKRKSVVRQHKQPSVASLPLQILSSFDGNTDRGGTSVSDAASSDYLLERVGRVVAQQRGGEICDITFDDSLLPSELADTYVPCSDGTEKGSDEIAARPFTNDEYTEEYEGDTSTCSTEGHEGKSILSTASVTASKRTVVLGQEEKGFDPGAGIAVAPDDQVYACVTCRRVLPEGVVLGRLSLCGKYIAFEPQQELPENAKSRNGGIAPEITSFDDTALPVPLSLSVDEAAPGLHRCWRWKYSHLIGVYLRRYRLRDSAIEIFVCNGSTHFLDFPLTTKHRRNEFVRMLYSFLPRSIPKQWPGRVIPHLETSTRAWQNRQMSNFDYLMALNTFAGRSFNDLTQYPVFPWVLSNYEDSTLDLSNPLNFRDLSKPVGALNATRLEEYWERYYSFDDPVIPKFLYGSHYSTCAGVVLFFLFRLEPFASLHQKMQGGTFDLPDRLFHSIQETWRMCCSQMSEVKELTPEFFASDGTFLRNRNGYALGKRHDQKTVEDVQLPKWAATPEEFVRIHRAALESEHVSRHLNSWIDLIFGYKQRGRASLQANNVFYYLTYYGVVDLDKVEDLSLRESMELQIAHFGQCPMQLFATPHPKRHAAFVRSSVGKTVSSVPNNSSVSGMVSPPHSGGLIGKESISSVPFSNIPRPLSLAFQDFSPVAQEKRQNWSPVATVKPVTQSGIRLLKTLTDCVVSVNELGVIEIYYWRVLPKPAPALPPTLHGRSVSASSKLQGVSPTTFSVEPVEASVLSFTDPQRDSDSDTFPNDLAPDSDKQSETDPTSDCTWLVEFVRDDSPFDYVPRIPVFDHVHYDNESFHSHRRSRGFPVAISCNGRVLVSGGSRSGALHIRSLDLDNGHVIGKASVVGHSAAVTCLSLDRWSYHSHSQITVPTLQENEELLVSGSQDGTLALWRLSRIEPDMLFRLPQVSPRPIQIFRGHATSIVDCCVSTYIGVVASCSHSVGMVHFLFDEGHVAFVFEPAEDRGELVRVHLSVKGYVIAITSILETVNTTDKSCETDKSHSLKGMVVSSVYQVFNLSGVLVQSHYLSSEEVSDVQVSAEGDLVFLTLCPGIIRICRIEDFVTVQEYVSSSPVGSRITATCFGPKEAVVLLASGHEDGTLSLQLLPDASGSVSFLANMRRLLGVSSKLKRVKGTVQHAQALAMSTLDNAKAATSTARGIAGEALGEAKVMMRGLFSYLQKG